MSYRLRLLTQNIWHGLNHTHPFVLPPLEAPWTKYFRRMALLKGLMDLQFSKEDWTQGPNNLAEVFCLQELNPVSKESVDFSDYLSCEAFPFKVNTGISAGPLRYPFFLEAGNGIFFRGDFQNLTQERKILSGLWKRAKVGPLELGLQIGEVRGAQLMSFDWAGRKFAVVNCHLHHEVGTPEARQRRSVEMDGIMELLEPFLSIADAIFVIGDFNCEHGDASLAPLMAQGFKEFLLEDGSPIHTWSPKENPQCRHNVMIEEKSKQEIIGRPKQLDHIFYRALGQKWGKRADSNPPWKLSVKRIFDDKSYGTWVSDHMGVFVEIEFE